MSATPSSQLWTSLHQGSVSDRIARQILDLVAAERLRPGDRLPPERELASLLGVSRPSLREAVRSLKAQGYLDVRHGTGVFVAEPGTARTLRQALAQTEVSLAELFDMREVVEVPAAAWAARHYNPAKLDAVREAYDQLREVAQATRPDFDRLQQLDESFHLRIVEAADNRFMSQTLGVLHDMLTQGMHTTLAVPGRLEHSRREHQAVFDAIFAGDTTGARTAARAHIRGARRAALQRLREEQARAR